MAEMLQGWPHKPAQLPFGTTAQAGSDGQVWVGDECYVLVDRWDGMVREHQAPASQAGPNMDLFHAQLRQAVAGQAFSALGLPEAITEEGGVDAYLLHFPPCAAAGGVSLDVSIDYPIHQMRHDAFGGIIHQTTWAMEIFWSQRRSLAQRVRFAKAQFEGAVAGAGAAGLGLKMVDFRSRPFEFVDSNCETLHEKLSLYIGVSAFDAALRPGVEHWLMMGKKGSQEAAASAVRKYLRNVKRLEQRKVHSADGLAAAFIAGAPGGPAAVLGRLAQHLTAFVVMPIAGGRQFVVHLYWSNGEIKARHDEHRRIYFHDDEVTLRDFSAPDVIEDSLVGRRLDQIVGLPVPCPVRIVAIDRVFEGSPTLKLETVFHPVDLAAGTIGEAIPY